MNITEHPFQPGARVAITDGWHSWREGIVEKTYKTGRFTLKGSTQQWRPSAPNKWGRKYWTADKTGDDSWSRTYLRIWDNAADTEINEIFAKQRRKLRQRKLAEQLEKLRDFDLTDVMLDQIEAALLAMRPDQSASGL